jgi:hypothetical protein
MKNLAPTVNLFHERYIYTISRLHDVERLFTICSSCHKILKLINQQPPFILLIYEKYFKQNIQFF